MSRRLKVAFFSNYLNHHQIPFCNEMYAILGDNFRFIATYPPSMSRMSLGWKVTGLDYPYEVKTYDCAAQYRYGLELGADSDVVVTGSAPDVFIASRLRDNKLTFRYSERLFKRGFWRLASPRTALGMYRAHTGLRSKNVYMLCASGYTAYDCSRIFAYPDKLFKWGYFPELRNYDYLALMRKKNRTPPKLLWVGRFLELKHGEDALAAAFKLKGAGYNFSLDFIGGGEREAQLRELTTSYGLSDRVTFLGSMPPEKVRDQMEAAGIFLFTSNRREGWGAVLNEAMNSGCAVVASHAIGAVPFLLCHRENGLIYKSGDVGDLFAKVKYLLDNPEERVKLGQNAARTITEEWNPKRAAENLLRLSEALLGGKAAPVACGPCSKAEIIKSSHILRNIGL